MQALIFELRPGALVEEGLVGALRKHTAALTAREQIAITVTGPEANLGLAGDVEEHLYRITTKALRNVVKHADAHHATVAVSHRAGILRLTVTDDGCGFDPGVKHPNHLRPSTMALRAATIGATLTITTSPLSGTTVVLSLPYGGRDQTTTDEGAA